jgi:hypothetical protein
MVGGPSEVYASSGAAVFCAGMNPLSLKDLLKGCLLVAFFDEGDDARPCLPFDGAFFEDAFFVVVVKNTQQVVYELYMAFDFTTSTQYNIWNVICVQLFNNVG